MGRSIVAVLAGFLVIALLNGLSNVVVIGLVPDLYDEAERVRRTGVLPVMLAYTALFVALGGWVAARLAPGAPLAHALALGAFGLLFNAAGTVAVWDRAPAWYFATGLALVVPAAGLGGWIRQRQLARQSAGAPPPAEAKGAPHLP